MVDTWFPNQFREHAINDACNSEAGKSMGSNDHFKTSGTHTLLKL
jgi:hypothetical protein